MTIIKEPICAKLKSKWKNANIKDEIATYPKGPHLESSISDFLKLYLKANSSANGAIKIGKIIKVNRVDQLRLTSALALELPKTFKEMKFTRRLIAIIEIAAINVNPNSFFVIFKLKTFSLCFAPATYTI